MSELNFMHENIAGIYNYCDRWCEKCSYTNRCLLFKQEAEREIKYILKDENQSDDEHNSMIIDEELEDLKEIIEQNSDMDFDEDANSLFEDEDEEDMEEYNENFFDENDFDVDSDMKESAPLIQLAEEMFDDFENYYKELKLHFSEEVEKYDTSVPLIKNLQTLSWYIPQVTVKARMCYWNKKHLEKAKNEISREVDEEMLNVSSRLAYLGLEKSISALNEILKQYKEIESETKLFLSQVKIMKKMLLEEFPNGRTYKRPYFD